MKWTLLLLVLCGCGVRDAGIEVQVSAQVTPVDGFDDATLAVQKIELFACQVTWLKFLNPISTAYAHGGDSGSLTPRVVATSALIDLRSNDDQFIATVKPPPGRICGMGVTFAPSTADAREQGTTLYVERGSEKELSTKAFTVEKTFDAIALDADHLDAALKVKLQMQPMGVSGDETLRAVLETMTISPSPAGEGRGEGQ